LKSTPEIPKKRHFIYPIDGILYNFV